MSEWAKKLGIMGGVVAPWRLLCRQLGMITVIHYA
jgi:hypothetical protein